MRRIRFSTRDTGPGLSVEACRRVFDPFTQLEPSGKRQYGGTGLGLAINRQIALLLGGTIGVESTPGKGSVFWFEIPLEFQEPLVHPHICTGGNLPRVLVVDSGMESRQTLMACFRQAGVQVDGIADWSDAEAVLARMTREGACYDFLVLSVSAGFPAEPGPDHPALAKVREIRVLPAGSRIPDPGEGPRPAYLVKPVWPRDIVRLLTTLQIAEPGKTSSGHEVLCSGTLCFFLCFLQQFLLSGGVTCLRARPEMPRSPRGLVRMAERRGGSQIWLLPRIRNGPHRADFSPRPAQRPGLH